MMAMFSMFFLWDNCHLGYIKKIPRKKDYATLKAWIKRLTTHLTFEYFLDDCTWMRETWVELGEESVTDFCTLIIL
jgi:hypothetical protein